MIRALMNHAKRRNDESRRGGRRAPMTVGTTAPHRACRPTRSPRNPAFEALRQQFPRPSSATRRRERRARRAAGGGGGALPRRGAAAPRRATRAPRVARALTPQRERRRGDHQPRPRREATQEARTIQEEPSPRRQTAQRATKDDSTSGGGGGGEPLPRGGAAAPAARRASLEPRGPYANETPRVFRRNAKATFRVNHVGTRRRPARRAAGGGGGALPRRGAAAPRRATRAPRAARALAPQRERPRSDRRPRPRREATQDAATIQEEPSPRRQTAQRATKADSTSGGGGGGEPLPRGGAAAPAARRASLEPRGPYANETRRHFDATQTQRFAQITSRWPRGRFRRGDKKRAGGKSAGPCVAETPGAQDAGEAKSQLARSG